MEPSVPLRIRYWLPTVASARLIQFLPQIRCFLGPARRPIPITATLTARWMKSDFTSEFYTPLKLKTFTTQWSRIRTRMVSMMQKKTYLIPIEYLRIPMAMGLPISKKSWATIPTSKLMAPTAGHRQRLMLRIVVDTWQPSPVWKRKTKWRTSGLPIHGWEQVTPKPKVHGNG